METAVVPQSEATLAELFNQVRSTVQRRWKVLAIVAIGVFLLGFVALFFVQSKYTAATHVRIDPTRNVAAQATDAKMTLSDQAIETEVSAFYSLALAQSVVDDLRLTRDPAYIAGLEQVETEDDRRTAVASNLLRNLSVTREQQTYVLNVAFTSPDPVKAALIANAFAANYIKGAVGARTDVASAQADWYQKQLQSLSREIYEADNASARFKAAHGLTMGSSPNAATGTIVDQQVPSLAAGLADTESTAAAARAEYQTARAQAARSGAGSVTAVLQSPVVTALLDKRAQALVQKAQADAQYGPLHPVSRQTADNLAVLDKQIAEANAKVITSLGSIAASADARAASLRSALQQVEGVRSQQAKDNVYATMLDRAADSKRQLFQQLSEEAQAAMQLSQNSMSSASIVDQAIPPKAPSSPNRPLFLVLAAILGIGAGAATIAIQEMLAGTIRSTEDIENKLGMRLLAAVPLVGEQRPASLLIERPTSFYSEAFRIARTSLFGSSGWPEATPIIAFTSSLPGDGKTTSSLAFARSLADAGQRTLLIDCDVRRAAMQSAAGIKPGPKGLVEYLKGDATIDETILRSDAENLDMIMVTAPNFTASNFFEGDRMNQLLAAGRERYDQVVIDLPPIVGLADGRHLAALADVVVFVIKWNATPISAARNALDVLQSIGKEPAGVLVNAVAETSEMLGGGYYYLDRYSNYYHAANT